MKRLYWIVIAAMTLIVYFGKKIVDFFVDWIWYISVGYQAVIYKIVFTRIALFIIFGLAAFLFIYINIYIANKLKPKTSNLEKNVLEDLFKTRINKLSNAAVILIVLFLAVLFGYGASHAWDIFLAYLNSTPFGKQDPLFLKDISFYVFSLPAIRYVYGFALAVVFLSLVGVFFIYFSKSAVQYLAREVYFTKGAKGHLFLLAAFLLALRAFGYKLDIYNLLYSTKGVVFGATYIDVYGYIPVYNIMLVLALLCAGVAVVNIFYKSWKPFAASLAAFILLSIVSGVYPAFLQKFIVKPNEISKETKFIKYNIKCTREAYNIDRIKEKDFPSDEKITHNDILNNSGTIKNVRLWDAGPILATYGQLQEIRTYYKFFDVDNDRYYVNGKYTQTMLSPREISYDELPSRIWINEHLTYTHGYGLCLGPVNRVTSEGLPEFFVKDIPPYAIDDMKIARPEIYFGELSNLYCFVNTKNKEFDYPSGDKNIYCEYKDKGQIKVGSIWRKLLFALKFSEPKIFFSQDITNDSRLMYRRKVLERVAMCAPGVRFEDDIYMVCAKDGNLYWIVEGFTASSYYPYSQPASSAGNYIRNSVKAVVNAYTGEVSYYISDEADPVIKTQNKIFPGVFKSLNRMPSDLKTHIRYPASLFKIQAKVFSMYHMNDEQVFYNKEDLWRISQKASKTEADMVEPYYTILKFPDAEKEEFILMVPFSPANKSNMIAWMAARCDAPNYGGIIAYRFPKQKLIYGISQIDARIDQDSEISKELTLWGQAGSRVIRGSLLVIPIEESIIYIEPLYLSAEAGQLPELKRIIVAYKDRVVMEKSLEGALRAVFGGGGEQVKTQTEKMTPGREETSLKELINLASEAYNGALAAQRDGKWALYGEKINELKNILEEMKRKK